jgi:hypothetical protein
VLNMIFPRRRSLMAQGVGTAYYLRSMRMPVISVVQT